MTKQQRADLVSQMNQAETMANSAQFGTERQQWLDKYNQLRQQLSGSSQGVLPQALSASPPSASTVPSQGSSTAPHGPTPGYVMPPPTSVESELLDPAKQKITDLTNALADARRNADVGSWGGSPADAAHWQRRAGEIETALNAAKGTLADVQSKLPNIQMTDQNKVLIQKALQSNSPLDMQALSESTLGQRQIEDQNAKLADFRNRLEAQYFGKTGGSLQDALSSNSGDIGQLNSFLGKQQSATFNQELRPLINMQMGGRGLMDSGANIELQSKALGQLERSRQENMLQAALGARAQLAGLGRQDVLGDIGARQQQLTSTFDLQRAGLTMQFQQQLEQQREQLARELASRQGSQSPGMWQQVIGGVGMAGSIAAAPYTGGTSLAALPAFAQYGFGSQSSQMAAGLSGVGQGFFRDNAPAQIPRTATVQNGQMTGYQNPWTGLRY